MSEIKSTKLQSITKFLYAVVIFIVTLGGLAMLLKGKGNTEILDQDDDLADQGDDIQNEIDKLKDEIDDIDTGDMSDSDVADYFSKD